MPLQCHLPINHDTVQAVTYHRDVNSIYYKLSHSLKNSMSYVHYIRSLLNTIFCRQLLNGIVVHIQYHNSNIPLIFSSM